MNLKDKINSLSPEKREKLIGRIRNSGEEYGVYPLTPSQYSFWCDHKANENKNKSTNTSISLRIRNITEERLTDAVRKLFELHDVFRYKFMELDGQPYQYYDSSAEFKMIRLIPEDSSPGSIEKLERDFCGFPFDLVNDSAVRFELAKLGENDFLLMFCVHHIVCDGYSDGVILRELYSLLDKGKTEGTVYQFAPFIRRINSPEGKKLQEKNREYWINKISDADKFIGLPSDLDRSSITSTAAGMTDDIISGSNYRYIIEYARNNKFSLYAVFASLFSIILQRWSCKDKIIMASTLFNRNDDRLFSAVGDFASVVPMVFEADEELTVSEYIAKNMLNINEAMEHGDVVYSQVAEAFANDRTGNAFPVYQTCLVYYSQNITGGKLTTGSGIEISAKDLAVEGNVNDANGLDLMAKVTELNDSISVSLQYSKNIFRRETIRGIADIFLRLLKELDHIKDRRISELILPGENEKRNITFDGEFEKYSIADIDAGEKYFTTSSGAEIAVLDDKNRPVPVSFYGKIYFRSGSQWYYTGRTGRIDSLYALEIREDISEVIMYKGHRLNITDMTEKLRRELPDVKLSFDFSDLEHLILNCGSDTMYVDADDVSRIISLRPDLVYNSADLAGSKLKRHQRDILRTVNELEKAGYHAFAVQRQKSDETDIIFCGDRAAGKELINDIRDKVKNERLHYKYSAEDISELSLSALQDHIFFEYPARKKSETELRMFRLWEEILEHDKFDIYDNFFDAGGDSLKIVSLMHRINKEFETDIKITDLFEYNTVKDMSSFIDRLKGSFASGGPETDILSF